MGKLTEESELYKNLSKKYDDEKKPDDEKKHACVSLELFNDCVDIAKKASKREVRYVLFNLKCLYVDSSGLEKLDILSNIVKMFVGNSMKASFIITVLETALEEE